MSQGFSGVIGIHIIYVLDIIYYMYSKIHQLVITKTFIRPISADVNMLGTSTRPVWFGFFLRKGKENLKERRRVREKLHILLSSGAVPPLN